MEETWGASTRKAYIWLTVWLNGPKTRIHCVGTLASDAIPWQRMTSLFCGIKSTGRLRTASCVKNLLFCCPVVEASYWRWARGMIVKAWSLVLKVTNHNEWYLNLRLSKTVDTCILLCVEDPFVQLYQEMLNKNLNRTLIALYKRNKHYTRW